MVYIQQSWYPPKLGGRDIPPNTHIQCLNCLHAMHLPPYPIPPTPLSDPSLRDP